MDIYLSIHAHGIASLSRITNLCCFFKYASSIKFNKYFNSIDKCFIELNPSRIYPSSSSKSIELDCKHISWGFIRIWITSSWSWEAESGDVSAGILVGSVVQQSGHRTSRVSWKGLTCHFCHLYRQVADRIMSVSDEIQELGDDGHWKTSK